MISCRVSPVVLDRLSQALRTSGSSGIAAWWKENNTRSEWRMVACLLQYFESLWLDENRSKGCWSVESPKLRLALSSSFGSLELRVPWSSSEGDISSISVSSPSTSRVRSISDAFSGLVALGIGEEGQSGTRL